MAVPANIFPSFDLRILIVWSNWRISYNSVIPYFHQYKPPPTQPTTILFVFLHQVIVRIGIPNVETSNNGFDISERSVSNTWRLPPKSATAIRLPESLKAKPQLVIENSDCV